jgi:hypothetical protein
MNLNALLIRGSVFMVFAMIMAFSAIRPITTAHAQSTLASASTAAAAPIVLPTITVRPSAADLMEAQNDVGQAAGALVETSATDEIYETLTPNMPSLRMDMPYYSFGKALRRGVKE